ncbi:MAG: hypothetical protein EOP19_01660 [Hyphomicrobiales bacterium]|nr:MAG: hypothetical protein EOP19_01660 [Hyphomicrobiales bacterium]
MAPETIIDFILNDLGEVDHAAADGDHFFMFRPEVMPDVDRRMPLATLVSSNRYDEASDLDREGVYRLNIGLSKETFRDLFGDGGGDLDHATLDRLLPHPVYANSYWMCVLNPSEATWERVKPLLEEAYDVAAGRFRRRKDA